MPPSSQTSLRELDKKLWTAADKLRSDLDAAVYKHAVLGLIFLKYVSDSFAQRQFEIEAMLKDPENDFFVDPAGYDNAARYDEAIHRELEERDYYIEKNVFWVPALARWKTLQDSAKLPAGTEILGEHTRLACSDGRPASRSSSSSSKPYKITSTGKLIDDALEAVEKENPKLKNVLNKNYTQLQIDPANLAGLIDLIATIPFQHADLHAKDILGQVCPRNLNLEINPLPPHSSSAFLGDLCAFAVNSSPSSMNMAIRGIDFDFGKEPADTFTRDQHPDLRADFVMALPSAAARSLPRSHPADRPNGRINPPFNIKEWWDGKLEGDARWKYGTPPQGNANFAWVQHMLHHLAPNGSMALLLANGSMSSNSSGEGDIRRALIEADLVECMVALPGQLFTNTQIPACIWFLTKNKAERSRPGAAALRDRRRETLFIDARKLGFMKDRVLRDFDAADIKKIAGTFREWRTDSAKDVAGFSKAVSIQEISSHDHVLTPGRFVGTEDIIDDGEPFGEKMGALIDDLNDQFVASAMLERAITANLRELGYGK